MKIINKKNKKNNNLILNYNVKKFNMDNKEIRELLIKIENDRKKENK